MCEQKYVCFRCVGEKYLKETIKKKGRIRACSYCRERNKSFELDTLAELIQKALSEHYYCTPDQPDAYEYACIKELDREWNRSGEPLDYVIQEMASVDEPIATDIKTRLSDNFDPHSGGNYDNDPHYELSDPSDWDFKDMWSAFRHEVIHHSRFFSPFAKRALDDIFHELSSLTTHSGKSAITNPPSCIYRARVVNRTSEVEQILKNPIEELGAPPLLLATAGRMNAHGISVFYGAEDIDTCINEIRPPVGSYVIIGGFTVLRDLKLLDFNVLTQLISTRSIFDPMCAEEKARLKFFSSFIDEISRPILPIDEQLDYTPTQIVAEYLAKEFHPKLDGFFFNSAQSATPARNIVLFNDSSKVENYDLPDGSEIDVILDSYAEDGDEPKMTIWEWVKKDAPKKENLSPIDRLFIPNVDRRLDSLRLDVNDLRVYPIQGVKYSYPSNGQVLRHRIEKPEGENTGEGIW